MLMVAYILQAKGYFPQAVVNYITSIGGGFHHDTLGKTLEEMVQSVSFLIFFVIYYNQIIMYRYTKLHHSPKGTWAVTKNL